MRTLILFSLMVLALPLFAHAEEITATGSTTGSGIVTERLTSDILQNILNIAPTRIPKNVKQFTIPEKVETAFQKEFISIRQRMAEKRTECRDIIRKSNRDQRMGKMLQCQRALLLLDMNLLRKQTGYINIIPLLDTTLKATATGAIAHLESAEMAIIDGIDTGLFVEESQLIAARNNLRTTYREPVWTNLIFIRADQNLTNVFYISKLLKQRMDVDTSIPLHEVSVCLEEAIGLLQGVKDSTDRQMAKASLVIAQEKSAGCRILLKAL